MAQYDAYPEATAVLDTDLVLLAQSPFTSGTTKKITGKNLKQSNYNVTPFIVGLTTATANYTSIQAAVTDAAAIATSTNRCIVYIQAGNYTENVTLAGNVDICGLMSSLTTNVYPVKITGTFTVPGTSAVAFNLQNLSINNSSAAPIVISGSSAITITITNSLLYGSGQNGITSTNAAAAILLNGVNIFSGASPFVLAGGYLTMEGGYINGQSGDCVIAGTGTSVQLSAFDIDGRLNVTGTSCNISITAVAIGSLTQSSVNLSGTTNTVIIQNCLLNSSNTNVVTGAAGNIVQYSGLGFTGTSSLINQTLTIQPSKGAYGPMTYDGTNYINWTVAGLANVTAPAGTYALQTTASGGDITPYVVGQTFATAPYTSINSAITAANAAFVATSNRQLVYIQPGIYAQNVTPLDGVDIIAFGQTDLGSLNQNFPVSITGQLVLTNAMNITIAGLQFNNTAAATVASSGSNSMVLNFVNCIITKTSGSGGSIFSDSAGNFGAVFTNCLFSCGSSIAVFTSTGGATFTFYNCFQRGTAAGISNFTGSNINYYNSIIVDSLQMNTTGSIGIYNSQLASRGNFSGVILEASPCALITNNSSFSVAPGFTNYVFSGASGATVAVNNAVYENLSAIDPNLVVSIYPQSPILNAAYTNQVNTFTAAQRVAFSTLTDASTITPNFSLSNNYNIVLGGNRTLGVPTNLVAGQVGVITVRQDITGSRTLAYAWAYQFAGGAAPVLSTAALSFDQLYYSVNSYSTATVTMTIATPCAVTWTAHGLVSGQRIQLTTTGALPTGLTASTTYWVTVIDANTFNLSTSLANAQAATFIATSGSQSGTQTAVNISITIADNLALA